MMNNYDKTELQKIQNEIQKIETTLKTIQTEAAEAQKQLNTLWLVIRDSNSTGNNKNTVTKPIVTDSFPSPADIMNYTPYLLMDGSIQYKTRTKNHNIPAKVVKMALESKTLKTFFEAFGLQVKDNRSKGGALWVKGTEDLLKPYVDIACRKFYCGGTSTSNGYATGYNIGWFTKCRR